VYVCKYIFFSVPIAVINQIEITSISECKKLIFDNQESGKVNRVYLFLSMLFGDINIVVMGHLAMHFLLIRLLIFLLRI
jgi:hypothetical protein